MGACASVPKAMRDEASSAPPPEPSKEESVKAEEVIKPQNEVVETKKQSLASLLDEPEKTEGEEAQQPQVEVPLPAEPKKEEAKAAPKTEEPEADEKKEAKKEEPQNGGSSSDVQKVSQDEKENKIEAKETHQ